MPIAAWVALFGIVVGAAVTLGVAYMQRKQMRPVELHRADPSVPLVPPPHAITRFLRAKGKYLFYLAFCVFDLWMLQRDMSQTTPITRTVVFYIVMDMIAFVLTAGSGIATAMISRSLTVMERMIGIQEMMTRALDVMSDKVKRLEKERDDAPPKVNPR